MDARESIHFLLTCIETAHLSYGQLAFEFHGDTVVRRRNPRVHIVGRFFAPVGGENKRDMVAGIRLSVVFHRFGAEVFNGEQFFSFSGEYIDGDDVSGLPFVESQAAHIIECREHVDGGAGGGEGAFFILGDFTVFLDKARAVAEHGGILAAIAHYVVFVLVSFMRYFLIKHRFEALFVDAAVEGVAHAVKLVGPRCRFSRKPPYVLVGSVCKVNRYRTGLFVDKPPFEHNLVVQGLVGKISGNGSEACGQ